MSFVFGFEDFGDEIPKSLIIKEKILASGSVVSLTAESAEASRRLKSFSWTTIRAMLKAQRSLGRLQSLPLVALTVTWSEVSEVQRNCPGIAVLKSPRTGHSAI